MDTIFYTRNSSETFRLLRSRAAGCLPNDQATSGYALLLREFLCRQNLQ